MKKMRPFIYTTTAPNRCTGYINATNLTQAKIIAIKKGLTLQKIKPQSYWHRYRNTLSVKKLYPLTQAISVLLQTGIPVGDTFALLIEQSQQPKQTHLLTLLYTQLKEGQSLASACEQCQFPLLYHRLIDVGEQASALPDIFKQLTEYYQRRIQLTKLCTKALMYPCCVFIVAIGVTSILLLFVIPKIESMFLSFDQSLPAFTQFVLSISQFFRTHGLMAFAASCLTGTGLIQLFKYHQGCKRWRDHILIKLPVIGKFYQLSYQASLCQTLATTLNAGLAADRCLSLCHTLCKNSCYRTALADVLQRITAGKPIHQALKQTGLFPADMVLLTAVGENTAQLPSTFAHLANQYQQQLDHMLSQLSSLLEPLLMVIMGILVGGLVIAMYLPIFQMGSTLG